MIIAIVGSIGAGKTTLARTLAREHGLVRISADDVRLQTTGSPTSWSPVVWNELMRRVTCAVDDEQDVVVDATGAASRFPALFAMLRPTFSVRLVCDWRTWAQREVSRGRSGVTYKRWLFSLQGSRKIPVNLTLDTTLMRPEEVSRLVWGAIEAATQGS